MPRKLSSSSLVVAKKPRAPRRTKAAAPVVEIPTQDERPVCHSCNSLPVGSVELVSLLLVLVFSLSAVLITSGYALDQQNQHVAQVEAQLAK